MRERFLSCLVPLRVHWVVDNRHANTYRVWQSTTFSPSVLPPGSGYQFESPASTVNRQRSFYSAF